MKAEVQGDLHSPRRLHETWCGSRRIWVLENSWGSSEGQAEWRGRIEMSRGQGASGRQYWVPHDQEIETVWDTQATYRDDFTPGDEKEPPQEPQCGKHVTAENRE